MKTLVNKHNPKIRVTAPEIEIIGTERYDIPVKRYYTLAFSPENWTLVEAEPEKLTWQDAQQLSIITRQVFYELDHPKGGFPKWSSSTSDMFEEVLRRFYEKKEGGK